MPSCQTGNIDWDFMCTMELYVEPFVTTIAMIIGPAIIALINVVSAITGLFLGS